MDSIIEIEPNTSYCKYCRGILSEFEDEYHIFCFEQVSKALNPFSEELYSINLIVILPHLMESVGLSYHISRPEYNFTIEIIKPFKDKQLFSYQLTSKTLIKPFELIGNQLFFINNFVKYYSFDLYYQHIIKRKEELCPMKYAITHWFFTLF